MGSNKLRGPVTKWLVVTKGQFRLRMPVKWRYSYLRNTYCWFINIFLFRNLVSTVTGIEGPVNSDPSFWEHQTTCRRGRNFFQTADPQSKESSQNHERSNLLWTHSCIALKLSRKKRLSVAYILRRATISGKQHSLFLKKLSNNWYGSSSRLSNFLLFVKILCVSLQRLCPLELSVSVSLLCECRPLSSDAPVRPVVVSVFFHSFGGKSQRLRSRLMTCWFQNIWFGMTPPSLKWKSGYSHKSSTFLQELLCIDDHYYKQWGLFVAMLNIFTDCLVENVPCT